MWSPVRAVVLALSNGAPGADTTTCVPTVYTCENGTAKSGTPSATARYTCENGTAKSGTPSGGANVVDCQSCKSGFKLNGDAGADTTTCVIDTTDTTKPTFTAGPTLDTSTDTTATITLTAREAGKLFWVLYLVGTPAPADAAALIAAASGGTAGEQRSGASATVTTAEETLTITGLTAATSYDFYAVLQDGAANTGDVSTKLTITTAAIYTCTDGMPKAGTHSGASNRDACQSCNSGFKLSGEAGATNTTCEATVYSCPANGIAKSGRTDTTADQVVCATCNPGFKQMAPHGGVIGANGTTCMAIKYICTNGTVIKTGAPTTGNTDVEACSSCNNRFKLMGTAGADNTTCVATTYSCSNGAAKTGSPAGHADKMYCASCTDSTHVVAAGACVPNNQFTLHPNGVTIVCPGVVDGATGDIGGTTYTKEATADITAANAATTCTSGVSDMSSLFKGEISFSGNISHWDTSKVTDMSNIFETALRFDADISHWDVSKVTDMGSMFYAAASFNQDIGEWDVSEVIDMGDMFRDAQKFNHDISSWKVGKVANMEGMFIGTLAFNQDIGSWDVSNVRNMGSMFYTATAFNQDLSGWCVSHISTVPSLFATEAFKFNAAKPNWGAECSP